MIAILCITITTAFEGDILLEKNSPYTIEGKSLTYKNSFKGGAYIDVDGVVELAQQDRETFINGIYLTLAGISDGTPSKAIVHYNLENKCGDGTCSVNETVRSCCTDCRCSKEFSCFSNQCYNTSLAACKDTLDCDDDNACSIDSCKGFPPKCSYDQITICEDNDGCCPKECNDINDFDCFEPDCKQDSECDDQNETTKNKCVPPGVCKFESQAVPIVEETKELIKNESNLSEEDTPIIPTLIPTSREEQPTIFTKWGIRFDIAFAVIILFFAGFFAAQWYLKT